jgi:hypothetical protein
LISGATLTWTGWRWKKLRFKSIRSKRSKILKWLHQSLKVKPWVLEILLLTIIKAILHHNYQEVKKQDLSRKEKESQFKKITEKGSETSLHHTLEMIPEIKIFQAWCLYKTPWTSTSIPPLMRPRKSPETSWSMTYPGMLPSWIQLITPSTPFKPIKTHKTIIFSWSPSRSHKSPF